MVAVMMMAVVMTNMISYFFVSVYYGDAGFHGDYYIIGSWSCDDNDNDDDCSGGGGDDCNFYCGS